MATKVAINGFGRIGRMVLRQLMRYDQLEVVGLNDIVPLDNLAYLLKYDSVQQAPHEPVEVRDDRLIFGGREIRYTMEKSPGNLPWKDLGVQIALECSGQFTKREQAAQHLEAGAQHVIISAPAKGDEPVKTFCMGVNEDEFDPAEHQVISNASCTTNCLAVVAKVLDEEFEIVTGSLTTVHAVTASQGLVDEPAKKVRRGRSAMMSIVPTTTGAAQVTAEVLPQLEGKVDGMAFRVPVGAGSIIDFVVTTRKPVTVASVNEALRRGSESDRLKGRLGYTEEELVSADIIGTDWAALVDGASTLVIGDNTAKVLAWYDNEWGYARTLAELAQYVAEKM